MPRHDAITDNDAWLESLSGHVATSRRGDRIRARAVRKGFNPVCTAARIEYYTDEYIGYADLRLRRDPVVGVFVMVDFLQIRPKMRGFGIASAIVTPWVEGLRGLGIAEMRFDAMRTGLMPGGRTFWAREGVLFRDRDGPYRLVQARLDVLASRIADREQPEPAARSWRQRVLRRHGAHDPDPIDLDEAEARALHALRQRLGSGELSTPADLYRHPLGRQVLAAADWSGRWPIDGPAAWHAPAVVWLASDFDHPERVELPTGHHLRPIRADDVDIDYPAVMGSREQLWAQYGEAWGWPPAGMTFEDDRADLARHETEIAAHESFNYAVLDECEEALFGCVYIDPPAPGSPSGTEAVASWWVVEHAVGTELGDALDDFVPRWLEDTWGFGAVQYIALPGW